MLNGMTKSGLKWIWLVLTVILIDQLTKTWVSISLLPYEPLQILPFMNFTLAHNTGAAFAFLNNASGWQNWLFTSIAVVVCITIFVWLSRLSAKEYWLSIALTLVAGGAIGNLWDRLTYGYVIDFFDFHLSGWHFAIFNVADSAICIGAAMLVLHWLFLAKK